MRLLAKGYIMLYRSLLDWRWYSDINTKILFIHLLLTVNYEPQKWREITIDRGQRVSSYRKLSIETGLSVQAVRTAVKHLISTGELTHRATAEYGIFTVVNYDKFQSPTHELTNDQQSANSQPTVDQQLSNKANKANKAIKKESKSQDAPQKLHFGEYNHIALTELEHQKLCEDYGQATIECYIQDMDDWIQLKGKSPYKDFNLAIRKWLNKGGETKIVKASFMETSVRTLDDINNMSDEELF